MWSKFGIQSKEPIIPEIKCDKDPKDPQKFTPFIQQKLFVGAKINLHFPPVITSIDSLRFLFFAMSFNIAFLSNNNTLRISEQSLNCLKGN